MRLSKHCVNENKNDWDECLDKILFSIRIQKQKSTKCSPFFLLYNRNEKVTVDLLEDNDNVYMVDESMTVNEINGSGEHEWNVNSNIVNQFSKIDDNCIDFNDSMNVMMYDSNNITYKDSMNILMKAMNIIEIILNTFENCKFNIQNHAFYVHTVKHLLGFIFQLNISCCNSLKMIVHYNEYN